MPLVEPSLDLALARAGDGAFVYLAKPFAAADFTAAVQQAVGRSVSS